MCKAAVRTALPVLCLLFHSPWTGRASGEVPAWPADAAREVPARPGEASADAAGGAIRAPAAAVGDSLAALRATVAELEQRVRALEADLAVRVPGGEGAAGGQVETLRLASLDLEGLGGANWGPSGGPPAGGVTIGAEDGGPLLRFSGFGDLQFGGHAESSDAEENHNVGQAELDLETGFSDVAHLAAAIAYNPDESRFELGVFAIDFHLWSRDESRPERAGWLCNAGVAAGQFDVPFGIDWQVNTSIDRRTVSRPLVVEATHGAWNDVGINTYAAADRFNVALFVLNGFDHQEACPGACAAPVEVRSQRAYGGRLGLLPAGWLEVGGSYAYLPSEADAQAAGVSPEEMSLAGADASLALGRVSLRGEYIAHRVALDVGSPAGGGTTAGRAQTHDGYYGTAMYDLGRRYLIAHYDRFTPAAGAGDESSRVCCGAGWAVRERCELRLEYQAWSEPEPDAAYLQLAVGF